MPPATERSPASPKQPSTRAKRLWSRAGFWLAALPVAALAVAARGLPVLRGGGLYGIDNYDDGVHYAAASGLVHGLWPYRDFLLLHPPGIVVLVAPFAALGLKVGDADAFAVARVSWWLLGAANAVLIMRLLRPYGWLAAGIGGVGYAIFYPAVYGEHTVLLEAPATTCLLLSLILLRVYEADRVLTARRILLAGVVLGFAASIKIWGVVPVLVIAIWVLHASGRRRLDWRGALLYVGGAAVGCAAVCLPFFLAAPAEMWRMVVIDQVGRRPLIVPLTEKLIQLAGLTPWVPNTEQVTGSLRAMILVVAVSVFTSLVVPRLRLGVALYAVLTAMLMLTPSWFLHYTALTAPLTVIMIGGACQAAAHQFAPKARWLGVIIAIAALGFLVWYAKPSISWKFASPYPAAALRAGVADIEGCVSGDHPTALIQLDVLSRNLDRGCRYVVDLGGYSYDLDSPDRNRSRAGNKVWQAYAMDYLRSGDAVVIERFYRGFGFNKASAKTVDSWPVLAESGYRRVREPQPPTR